MAGALTASPGRIVTKGLLQVGCKRYIAQGLKRIHWM